MRLTVAVSGRGADLVLLHGWGMSAAVWEPLLPHLEGRWRVHRVDLPGHGQSPWSEETRLTHWVAAVRRVVPERAVWAGWSLGGLVALQAALEGAARALLLVAANPRFIRAPDWPCALEATVLARFARDLQDDPQGTVRRFLALQVQGSPTAHATLRALRAALARRGVAHPQALAAGLAILEDTDLRPQLARLAQPRRWLLGGRDRLVPPELAACLEAQGERVRLLPEAAHAPFLSHPAVFAETLEALA